MVTMCLKLSITSTAQVVNIEELLSCNSCIWDEWENVPVTNNVFKSAVVSRGISILDFYCTTYTCQKGISQYGNFSCETICVCSISRNLNCVHSFPKLPCVMRTRFPAALFGFVLTFGEMLTAFPYHFGNYLLYWLIVVQCSKAFLAPSTKAK